MNMRPLVQLVIVLATVAGCDVGPTGPEASAGQVENNAMLSDDGLASSSGVPPDLLVSDLEAGVTLEQVARRWIGYAERLFQRASQLAGPDPEPPVSAWLQVAGHMLDQAKSSYGAGQYQAAIQHAQVSAQKSQDVIDALSDPGSRGDLEVRAEAAIDHARALLREAIDLAGDNPERRVRSALARADELLEDAVRAFQAGEFQQAIRFALQSARISETVIRYLNA